MVASLWLILLSNGVTSRGARLRPLLLLPPATILRAIYPQQHTPLLPYRYPPPAVPRSFSVHSKTFLSSIAPRLPTTGSDLF